MPSRLSKILSRTTSSKDKEAEAEAEAERNGSKDDSPPPSYAAQSSEFDQDNVLHPPDVTAGFSNLTLNGTNNDFPQVDQCIAHLKVLEAFYRLRQKIGSSDGLFEIKDSLVLDRGLPADDKTPELLAKLAEKRWAIYVTRAVDRFDKWSAAVLPKAQMARYSELQNRDDLCDPGTFGPLLKIDKDNVPPLDVLMVWHAYQLNPRAYLEDCLRLGRMQMWHAGFPFQGAVDSINSETFVYEASEEAISAFTSLTGLAWNNLDDRRDKRITCPRCDAPAQVPLTTCQEAAGSMVIGSSGSWNQLSSAIDSMMSSGTGYCDKDFRAECVHCHTQITHDRLKAQKFFNDLDKLLADDVPMGGTLLGLEGIPWKFAGIWDPQCSSACTFPNIFLKMGIGQELMSKKDTYRTVSDIREIIQDGIGSIKYIKSVHGGAHLRATRPEKIAIRRLMSRYWENSSPFALDLVGAVIRQGVFVEKMHNIDWLHSPALPSTMKRLLVKYQRFVSIMKDKWNMAVPTLDVDLAWHTHQLSPYSYMKYTVEITKQFIDHDDKVAETKLNDAFAWTSKTYQKLYGEPYSECQCWYCEAVRESHTNVASRLFKTKNNEANEQLHDVEQDPRKSVHISAHNAVRPDDFTYQTGAQVKAELLEKQYQKACDRARKKGRKVPRRDDYYYSDAWGYPVYMPAYSPYFGVWAYSGAYYGYAPGCMALGAGAAGNCCKGTCGAAVAAGGCGGGGGGCAGGAAGGCGGGAGGGCGGGGGGGGCGGGGGGGGCGGGGG